MDTARTMSIRLRSGGHSFRPESLPPRTGAGCTLHVTVLTHRTTLVPAGQFLPEAAAGYLAAAGLPPASGEEVRTTAAAGGRIVAVMAVAAEALRALEACGAEIVWDSPLLHEPASRKNTLWLLREAGTLYLKRYDAAARLRFAEAVRAADDDETLYYVARLSEAFPLDGARILVAGECREAVRDALRRYYKETVCE